MITERPDGQRKSGGGAPLKILILGGTAFLGPHLIRYALERGHSISTFSRGRTAPALFRDLYSQVEQLIGDRGGDLDSLVGRRWDAVIDNSGRRVSWTRDSAQVLENSADLYLYTSGRTVYTPYLGSDIGEDTPIRMSDDPPQDPPSIGVIKSNSEAAARKAFGDARTIIVRPSYVVGPADSTNRFQYWPDRVARGGEVLVPGRGDDPVQFIDVRDLTEFMIRLVETRTTGTLNATGPASPLNMSAFVTALRSAVASDATVTEIEDYGFLEEHGLTNVVPWIMPVRDNYGFARINIDLAIGAGLTHRPLETTITDTLEWWRSGAVAESRRARAWSGGPGNFALTLEREKRVLAAWRRAAGRRPAR